MNLICAHISQKEKKHASDMPSRLPRSVAPTKKSKPLNSRLKTTPKTIIDICKTYIFYVVYECFFKKSLDFYFILWYANNMGKYFAQRF